LLPAERIDRSLLRRWPLPVPGVGSKDERGEVFVVAGAAQTPGAAILAATSALNAGAGKLKVATAASVAGHVAAAVPESLVVGLEDLPSGGFAIGNAGTIVEHANGADALVLGPGLIDDAASGSLACAVLAELETPVLLDAAALAGCAADPDVLHRLDGRAVLTPHAGEMARMMRSERDAVEEDPARFARDAARRLRAVVVMKGAMTYIARPDGALFCNTEGDVGLATSGSGDTLAGIIGGLLARGMQPIGAAVWGVYLHAQAGRALSQRIGLGFLAREIPAEIPGLMRWAG
jgi:hydroxyethylthiazole kinase-like uncharacterized protein yjeF